MTEGGAPRDGVLFVATGETFLGAAERAARSVKATNPGLDVAIATDCAASPLTKTFDHVILVERPHRRSKVDMLTRTPFDRTLFLDTDVRVVADLSGLFALLDRFDLAIAHAHNRNKSDTTAIWRVPIPDAFPQCNSGVLAYRSTPATHAFFEQWSQTFDTAELQKDQVTLRELLWQTDLSVYILPPEYNIRHTRYLKFWRKYEAVPKILHMARYNQEHLSLHRWLVARLKEVTLDLIAGTAILYGALVNLALIGTRRR